MTEKEFERLEKARDIKGKIETCDGIIEGIFNELENEYDEYKRTHQPE